jgi:signal transduction histidine kinase
MKWPPRNDAIVALGLLVLVLVEQATYIGWSWEIELLKVPGVLAVAWRRVYPVSACLVAVVGLGVGEWFEDNDSDSFGGFAAMLLALFSLTAHAARQHIVPGMIAASVVVSAASARQSVNAPDGAQSTFEAIVGGVLFAVIVVLTPAFAIGWGARRQAELRRRLEEQALELELERERHAEAAAGEERAKMAADLHEVVADGVRAMLGELGEARRDANADPGRAEEAMLRVEERGREALVEMRSLLGVLRRGDDDLALAPQPSVSRLDALAQRITAGGVDVELRVEGTPRSLTPGLDVAAFRVVEDALGQAAGAKHAEIVVRWADRDVGLEVGIDGPQLADAEALGATRERVGLFGGRLDLGRRPGGGSVLRAQLPAETTA